MGKDHAQSIWEATIAYLESCLTEEFNEKKGMNDENIFSCLEDSLESSSEISNIFDIVSRNPLLGSSVRKQFMADIKNEPNLIKLLKNLAKMFQEEIFHEMTVIIY